MAVMFHKTYFDTQKDGIMARKKIAAKTKKKSDWHPQDIASGIVKAVTTGPAAGETPSSELTGVYEAAMKNTPGKYLRGADEFISYMQKNELALNDPQNWIKYTKHLNRTHRNGKMKGKKYSVTTYNFYLACMKNRLNYILDTQAGEMSVNEYHEVKKVLESKDFKVRKKASVAVKKDKTLSYAEVEELTAAMRVKTTSTMADIVELLSDTGIRVFEAINILLTDIKPSNGHYSIHVRGKGSKDRDVEEEKSIIDRMKQGRVTYLFEPSPGIQYTRQAVTMAITRAGRNILHREISSHTLRHTFATEYLRLHPEQLKGLSIYLGHSSPATTIALYVHNEVEYGNIQSFKKDRK
jgi:integrase